MNIKQSLNWLTTVLSLSYRRPTEKEKFLAQAKTLAELERRDRQWERHHR